MKIDIIDLSDPEYRDLSAVQLDMVRTAQGKKDKLTQEAEEKKRDHVNQLIVNGWYRSTLRSDWDAEIDARLERDVEALRENLLYQLAYKALASDGNENGLYRYPENPNYNLAYAQRFLVVRQYYMDTYSDPKARLQALSADSLARQYLGDFYRTLYDLFLSYC